MNPMIKRLRERAGVGIACAALLIAGAGTLLAAPGVAIPPHTTRQAHLAAMPGATSTSSPISTPTAASPVKQAGQALAPLVSTDPPSDTPTTAPTPTDIPPTPNDTPTPVLPSWHIVASYNGTAPQSLPDFTTAYPWLMAWTCQPAPQGQPAAGFSFSVSSDGTAIAGGGNTCDAPASAQLTTCASAGGGGGDCAGSHTYTITWNTNGQQPMCQWAAIIEEWY